MLQTSLTISPWDVLDHCIMTHCKARGSATMQSGTSHVLHLKMVLFFLFSAMQWAQYFLLCLVFTRRSAREMSVIATGKDSSGFHSSTPWDCTSTWSFFLSGGSCSSKVASSIRRVSLRFPLAMTICWWWLQPFTALDLKWRNHFHLY